MEHLIRLRLFLPRIPRVPGVLVYFISFFTMILARVNGTDVSIGLSVLVGVLAAIDHVMKIHWKIRQEKKERREQKNREAKNDEDHAGTTEG